MEQAGSWVPPGRRSLRLIPTPSVLLGATRSASLSALPISAALCKYPNTGKEATLHQRELPAWHRPPTGALGWSGDLGLVMPPLVGLREEAQ